MSNLIKITYEIQVQDEQKFRSFYDSLGELTHYTDTDTVCIQQLIEDFIICQDIYKQNSNQNFSLEGVGLELVDSYSMLEPQYDRV